MRDLEIREQIRRYVNGGLAANELEDWLETEAWNLNVEPARTLAGDVLRLLAEQGHGDWTEDELRARLGNLSRTYWFEDAPKDTWGTSGAGIILEDQRSAAVGRSPSTASA